MDNRRHRWWLMALVLLTTLGGGTAWYRQRSTSNHSLYLSAQVTSGELVQLVTASGQLNPVIKVLVGSQISGTIQKLFADHNSIVTNNQVIAQLDPAICLAAVHQCEGELKNVKAALELAQLNATRAQALFGDAIMPEAECSAILIALHQAEANVEIKEAAVEKARVDLTHCTIHSPVDGVVISRNVDVGQTVAASLSAPTLFEIANNLTNMQIDAYVSEADVGSVQVGQEVSFTVDAFPNRLFQGKVAQVRNAATTVQNVVTYDTVIEVNNADLALRPGMTANVAIVAARHPKVLTIPNAALRYMPSDTTGAAAPAAATPRGKTVYVLPANGNDPACQWPVAVAVQTGISDGLVTEVLEGLKAGDQVVTGLAESTPSTTHAMSQAGNPLAGTPSRPPPR